MIRHYFYAAAILFVSLMGATASIAQGPRERNFTFDYAVTVNGVSKGDTVQIWMPVPRTDNVTQVAKVVSSTLPGDGSETVDPKYKNRMIYRSVKATSGDPVSAAVKYKIKRKEVRALDAGAKPPEMHPDTERLFLSANSKVPIKGIPLTWTQKPDDVIGTARDIYDRVDGHVRYDKSKPGYGNGDTMWVCDSKFGNCTDFHSLFISMARASGIPSRFEIGFPLPADKTTGTIGGYHCWASFYSDKYEWVPVDISEADKHPEMKDYFFGNLTPDRVGFTIGRDIDLVPQQAAPPLNYFVYPHVEINGKPATKEQLTFKFGFEDVKADEQN